MKRNLVIRRAFALSLVLSLYGSGRSAASGTESLSPVAFHTSDRCVACHNGMTTTRGEEFSIGTDWSTSLMANASRDPYWHASVRKEVSDHPESQAKIEQECSACHMPILQYEAKLAGRLNPIFSRLPLTQGHSKTDSDGVTCSICHQITPEHLGTPETYNGNFVIGHATAEGSHAEYGPYDIGSGLQQVMRSSTGGFQPQLGVQIRSAELCATCHTLITEARGANGEVIGTLPEQMPYQEWLHSDFKSQRTCQSCHMPAVEDDVPIARILGEPRSGAVRHQFVGANFFMQRLLGRYHDELDVAATPADLSAAADRTIRYLKAESVELTLAPVRMAGDRLEEDVTVRNRGGHKLPTAFPSRRVWLHVSILNSKHQTIFESGALNPDGSIVGNDNDTDPARFEPHYTEIRTADQVQIYEAILEDTRGGITTGLLTAVNYAKDNRLLPHGFDKGTAGSDIAVHGAALNDPSFNDTGHRIRYSIDVQNERGPFEIIAEVLYQPIGYRWAKNLQTYPAREPQQFSDYFNSMTQGNAVVLARASAALPGNPDTTKP